MPQVSVITVGMNHKSFIKRLYDSIFLSDNTSLDLEVIYVDNCSKDGSVEFVKENYPKVKVIVNDTPMGFGANNNKGAEIATGKYLAIINPDVIVKKGSFDILYEYAETHDDWGVLAPKLLNADSTLQYSVRAFVSLKIMFYRFFTAGKDHCNSEAVNYYLYKDIDATKTQPVDWAIGAALFVKTDFFRKQGGFDMDYFLYMEDEDFCLRSWQANKPVMYVPQAEMMHTHLRSSSKFNKMTFVHMKSMFTFFRKHGFNVKGIRRQSKQV